MCRVGVAENCFDATTPLLICQRGGAVADLAVGSTVFNVFGTSNEKKNDETKR